MLTNCLILLGVLLANFSRLRRGGGLKIDRKIAKFLPALTFDVGKRKEKVVSRSVEQKLREAVRYVGSDGEEKPKPIQQRKKRPSAKEARLMDAKKAFKQRRDLREPLALESESGRPFV